MNEDGRMARLNDLFRFSKKHNIRIASIEDLISYRLKNEKLIVNTDSKNLDLKKYGTFGIKTFKNKLDKSNHYVIYKGRFSFKKPARVRVISIKITKNKINFDNDILTNSLNYLSKYSSFAFISRYCSLTLLLFITIHLLLNT